MRYVPLYFRSKCEQFTVSAVFLCRSFVSVLCFREFLIISIREWSIRLGGIDRRAPLPLPPPVRPRRAPVPTLSVRVRRITPACLFWQRCAYRRSIGSIYCNYHDCPICVHDRSKLFHNHYHSLSRHGKFVFYVIIYNETNYNWNVHSERSCLLVRFHW